MRLRWWQRGIIYEVYARSFQDSDGDGTGDLRGIAQRLDHLVWLGVDAVWITPVYPSPMADFGYDVADYCGIDPLFGTLAEFDALVSHAHARGLKVIVDYVPNHTSDRHPWFIESSVGRASAKRDWYIWRDPAADGGPPNNWLSNFNGPAWTFDPASGQYYLHSFLPSQPDLNWRNSDLRSAMYDALRFWLARGVDGIRVDVIWLLVKDALFRDNPPNPDWRPGMSSHDRLLPIYTTDRPETQQVVAELRRVLDEYDDRVLLGEIYLPVARLAAYYGAALDGAHLPFNFQLLLLREWTAAAIAKIIVAYDAALPAGAWPNWVLGNHDRPRIASRVGPAQARVAAILLLTLRGTPTIYMGDELGMVDTPIPADAVRDPAELREPGQGLGRDPERTPYPWAAGPGAGFTSGQPWLPVGGDRPLSEQASDPASMVSLHRRLIALRRTHPALVEGALTQASARDAVLSYLRTDGTERIAVLLNTADAPSAPIAVAGALLASTHAPDDAVLVGPSLVLRADEGIVVLLDPP